MIGTSTPLAIQFYVRCLKVAVGVRWARMKKKKKKKQVKTLSLEPKTLCTCTCSAPARSWLWPRRERKEQPSSLSLSLADGNKANRMYVYSLISAPLSLRHGLKAQWLEWGQHNRMGPFVIARPVLVVIVSWAVSVPICAPIRLNHLLWTVISQYCFLSFWFCVCVLVCVFVWLSIMLLRFDPMVMSHSFLSRSNVSNKSVSWQHSVVWMEFFFLWFRMIAIHGARLLFMEILLSILIVPVGIDVVLTLHYLLTRNRWLYGGC